jgi:hypothetical protein
VQIFYLAFSMMAIIIDRLELRVQNCFKKRIIHVRGCILDTWKDFFFVLSVLLIVHAATSTNSRRCCEGVGMIVWENGATIQGC